MLRIFFSGCEIGYFGQECDEKCRLPNMVFDVSCYVTVLKRTATISVDVETFLQVHIFEYRMR